MRDEGMKIKILHFNGCPNWEMAAARVRTVLAELDRADVAVECEDVHQTSHLPSEWAGSPTVLLEGRDPFAAAEREVRVRPGEDLGRTNHEIVEASGALEPGHAAANTPFGIR